MREEARISAVLAALTLEEKASLLSGQGAWETAAVERLGIGSVILTDGPHGVRMQAHAEHFTLDASLPAKSLPLDCLIVMTGGRLDTAGIGQFLDPAYTENR